MEDFVLDESTFFAKFSRNTMKFNNKPKKKFLNKLCVSQLIVTISTKKKNVTLLIC